MSNFLNRLITKSLAGAEEIQPRPVSVFEPPALDSNPGLEHPPEEPEPDGDNSLLQFSTSVATPLIQTPPVPAASPPPVRPQLETIAAVPAPPDSHSVDSAAAIAPTPVQSPQQTEADHRQSSSRQPPASPIPAPTNPKIIRSVQPQFSSPERSQPITAPDSASLQTIAPQHAQDIPSSTAETIQPGREPAFLESILPAIQSPPATSVGTLTQPHVKPLPQPEIQPPQSAQPPTIRVTINRIDVRAVTPPTPPTPSRRSPPAAKLSLADYLKQRPGGQR
ncbi:MAG: hypothetical protein HC866_09440 [Leptolyngbyaceae cyanobacterium RU_5_1]|nr:hypothetical protein [Leptolyngbyaceae cyanobacterium RU_5_1]